MKYELLKNFEVFKKCLIKGAIFIYKKYKFQKEDVEKSRPIIILNNIPPHDKKDIVYYSTLTGEIQRYSTKNKPKEIIIIRNGILKCASAFNLGQVIKVECGKLHCDFLNDILDYKGNISKKIKTYLDKEIILYFSDNKLSKTIPNVVRKAILLNNDN